jgi:hypothetical protein
MAKANMFPKQQFGMQWPSGNGPCLVAERLSRRLPSRFKHQLYPTATIRPSILSLPQAANSFIHWPKLTHALFFCFTTFFGPRSLNLKPNIPSQPDNFQSHLPANPEMFFSKVVVLAVSAIAGLVAASMPPPCLLAAVK